MKLEQGSGAKQPNDSRDEFAWIGQLLSSPEALDAFDQTISGTLRQSSIDRGFKFERVIDGSVITYVISDDDGTILGTYQLRTNPPSFGSSTAAPIFHHPEKIRKLGEIKRSVSFQLKHTAWLLNESNPLIMTNEQIDRMQVNNKLSHNLSQLHKLIGQHFNRSEIKSLCLELGVPFEDLEGGGLSEIILSLIEYMKRREQLTRLADLLRHERQHVNWPELP